MTRAVAALLHGRVAQAARYNVLSLLIVPALVVRPIHRTNVGRALLIAFTVGFAILRNIK
jgi:hypothetical protein